MKYGKVRVDNKHGFKFFICPEMHLRPEICILTFSLKVHVNEIFPYGDIFLYLLRRVINQDGYSYNCKINTLVLNNLINGLL